MNGDGAKAVCFVLSVMHMIADDVHSVVMHLVVFVVDAK